MDMDDAQWAGDFIHPLLKTEIQIIRNFQTSTKFFGLQLKVLEEFQIFHINEKLKGFLTNFPLHKFKFVNIYVFKSTKNSQTLVRLLEIAIFFN